MYPDAGLRLLGSGPKWDSMSQYSFGFDLPSLQHRFAFLRMSVAASSFSIQGLKQFGPISLIHALSIYTLVMLPFAVVSARRHNVAAHKKAMIGMFAGALVVAGLFTLYPGRVMHAVLFGGVTGG